MHASTSFKAAAAAALLFLDTVAAAAVVVHPPTRTTPRPQQLRPRAPAATDLWVTVDESGKPKTVTPVHTTISGTPTVISAAPNDVTGSVFTRTQDGDVRTTTGDAGAPAATGKDGAGAFAICNNLDGENAPFCEPDHQDTLNPGKTYYITWDSKFFNGTNTTVVVMGSYINDTTGAIRSEAFSSDKMSAGWGFYSWAVDKTYLVGGKPTNITLMISALGADSPDGANRFTGPTVRVADPEPYRQPRPEIPGGPALYIGLPTILGFVVIVLVGTCLWNRKARRINLGNIMSRSRHGYGVGKSRAQRLGLGGRRNKEQAIHLMEREVDGPVYRDEDQGGRRRGPGAAAGTRDDVVWDADLPRRDSDGLGSLAGTPTEDRHMDFRRGASPLGQQDNGNAFREELSRQQRERD